MKNLLIYVHPEKKFDDDTKDLAKIQIDNMLDLGWIREDIILATNFDYEYNGIKAIIVPDRLFYAFDPTLAKISGIVYLFEQGLIGDEIYFCHDFDHYQTVPLTQAEIEKELAGKDLAMTDYGRVPRWHLSCIFFRKSSRDIFELLVETTIKSQMHNEEDAMLTLTENNINGIGDRIKKLNISYNFWGGNLRSTYPMADKPIKGVHFQPVHRDRLEFFMYGKNKLDKVLIDERLIKLFNKHGVK